jgi:hypothetical protein
LKVGESDETNDMDIIVGFDELLESVEIGCSTG